jgi:pyruvate-formate lyase-activating enzyme
MKNDIFKQEYKQLTPECSKFVLDLKAKAQELYDLIDEGGTPNNMRMIALAKTKLEESIMWAVKGLTN